MGTPHQGVGGSALPLGTLLVNVASLFVAADDRLLQHLKRDSEWLQQQLGQYGPISGEFVTKFAYEEYETPAMMGRTIMVCQALRDLTTLTAQVVPKASAVVPGAADAEPIIIHTDHINMVRFTSRDDNGYETVSGHLHIMVQSATNVIATKWEKEDTVDASMWYR